MMASTREIVEEPPPPPPSPVHVVEDKVYVAVGTDLKESKSVITWALRHSGGRKICILHVHEPAQRIPCMGIKIPVSQLREHQVRAYRQVERQEMNKLLRDYCTLCSSAGVHAEVVHMEMNSIEKGILELIKEHGITKLVMGAAANKHYSKKMMEPKSKKAIYVRLQAPMSCKIWFICKGNLVHTREGRSEGVSMEVAFPTLQAGPNAETGQSSSLRSKSVAEGANDQLRLTNSGQNYRRAWSALPGLRIPTVSSNRSSVVTPHSSSIAERSSVDWDERCNSHYSSRSFDDMADVSTLTKEDHHQFSSPPSVLEGHMSAELYDQLEQSMAEAENSRREAFDESRRRRKAEKDAIDAIHRAKASERLYAEEVRQRKEVEEALARVKEELRKMKQQVAEVAEELYIAVEHKSSLESQIANSNLMVKDLEQKLFSAEKLLQKYKKERDELQAERDNALKEAEELRKEQAETSANTLAPEFFSEFPFSEIKEATSSFDLSLKIGEGGYGNIYKGLLHHTEVAIKMLHTNSKQGPSEYQQEAKASENLHGEELRQTKEVEEMVKDLEQKMFSAVQLSQKYNHMERDELQMECNNVLKEAKELRKEQAEVVVYTPAPVFFSEFSYSEIVQATSSFNQSLMIGQGGCGDIYKGLLRHIQLAIKMLHSNSMQGPLEFQQEAVTEELIKMAKISYKSFSLAEKNTAQQFFKELNRDYDGKVSCHEFLGFIRDKGLAKMGSHHFFQTLDRDGSEILDFVQAMALYCMIQSGRPFCYGCDEFIPGMYFTCSSCHQSGKNVCCLCPQCFENGTYCHEHDQFFDNYEMLEVKRMKGLDTDWKQQHQNWAKKKGNSLRDEIPFEVSSISMDEKLDSRLQFMHMSQFDRSSPRPLALPDGGGIVGSIASSVSEVATTNNRAHLVGQDQCGSTVSHYEIRNNRETSGKQGLTMSLSCVEDHLQAFGCKHKDDVKSLCERQAFDATNNRANIIKADECGPTASNSDKGSTRKALKRARLSNVLSVEDLQQHFGARCKDAAKGLGDSIARKSVKVGDIPLGAQSNSIIFLVRRRTLTHKHCVRLKKSQDLQRSLRMDCSGGLSSQSAIGLPDGRHILSLSEKKIVRKTLKRKCRTMCVHILEDHRQHVHRRWENAAKASTTKHNSRQLVMHGVSIAKRICRQHGINQWPFQKHYATRKQYSLGDERSVEVTSLATDGNLVSRLQLIHISWLGRFSPWRSTLPAIALLSSEFAATINGANFVEQDQSGSTASHSGKKIIRQTENGEWINSSISLENLQQLFGSKRKNAAESLSVSESTFKRICRQHGIERWPSQRGSRERQAFDATNNRANIIKADERSPTASNSDKESMRKAFKRARLSNVLSVEDLQQHFGARCKDAAKGLGDSIAWKSVKVLDSPLGAQSNNIIFSVRRRALTHKHCVRLKKSQDLQRSLRMDCSRGLSSQSAIGLPDGRHVPSLLEKKIVRKTLKRKCRTMCVHILEDHRHLDRRWENAAKASTTKHNCWQLVMHGVSTAKRIRRQHGINQWPFQRHFATRKRYSLGDERSVEATSLATDGKLVSRLQLIHISWLGRFSPRRSTLPAIALLSSEFVAKINGANFVERDQSGSTASHSGKKIIRRTANGEWINSSISLENLQQLFGSKRKDAAERLGVSESKFKRICRQHGIERWPSQRGSQVLKPPDPAERNESTTCKALSTHGQIEIENEMVGQLHEPNEFPPDFFDGLPCWNTENGILFPQPQVASTQMSSGNMGSSGDCRNLLVSQAEPSLEGHGSEAIYWTMPPCSDLASSQQTPTIPYTMLSIPHTTPPLTIQQDMRSLTIKAIYGDTIIKFKLPLSSGIIGLKEEVSKRLKFELDSFEVKYKDECGDLILIACDEDLRDCLELFNSSGHQEIRLLVFDRFANTTNFCKNCRSLKRKRA